MKKLKKILLINWLYFSKEIIEVGDVNFLTGKNGAGKSTVIDALQIVLLGETNARNFNQAANEKSQRTLDGYLRADMDENNPYSRRGKDFSSYIACEFQDDVEGTSFVTGVVFDCRSDGSKQERFFIYVGTLPENCFVENGEAMEIPALRRFLKQHYAKAEIYDTQKEYRRNMLSRWNVHNEQVLRMMKKAVSFRPIVDIQKFITENICDIPEKPDIEAMQQNIRDYKRHEMLAQRQEEKLAALQEIGKLYREMNQAIDRWRVQSFLVLWSQKEIQQAQIDRFELEKQDCITGLASTEESIESISSQIAQKESRRRELDLTCAQSSVFQEEEKLRNRKQALLDEQKKLLQDLQSLALEIKRETLRLDNLCNSVLERETEETLLPVQEAAADVLKAYSLFTSGNYEIFSHSLTPFENAQQAVAEFSKAIRDVLHKVEDRLAELKEQKDQKSAILVNLQKNIKDYPRGLLQFKERLATELEHQVGGPIKIDILADVLELTDERWRGAVEGYLNAQKFYLLVDPTHYRRALSIFDRIKKELGSVSFGLVDISKLRERETINPRGDSLAKKVDTESKLARSYIDYLLGRVVCCEKADQLRNFKTAITADGMLYQGYVARLIRRELMDDAFIGRRAVSLRISRLEEDLKQVEDELRYWNPIRQLLAQSKEPLFTHFFVQNTIVEKQTAYLRGIEIASKVASIDDQLSKLDLLWLDEQRRTIAILGDEIIALNNEKDQKVTQVGQFRERIRQLDYEVLPDHYQQLTSTGDRLQEEFPLEYQENTGIPRYQQELTRLKRADVVYKNFSNRLEQSVNERDTTRRKLFSARREYTDLFKPCSFRVESMDNDEFETEQRLLEESELPKYREKIKAARESAMEQFQNDFLAKLKSSIDQVQDQVKNLNRALRQAQFGTDSYQFRIERNPDYAEYYDMIMAPELMEGDMGLFAFPFQDKYGQLIEKLFSQITMADDTQLNARKQSELQENIQRYTDFRTYLKFDLETTDQNGSKQLLSQTLNTKSGGETQTPFYIAVLASFAQLYRVNDTSSFGNTVRLAVFDEAFNKMDSDRIIESVRLLRKMGLQAIICTPPDKVSDIMPIADRTLLVDKNKYRMHILPFGKEMAQ
ncbi:MAG: ATP-binding protein [Candidatus Heteroscillospira sp.]|jgi:uncharacterized protein YPO0396